MSLGRCLLCQQESPRRVRPRLKAPESYRAGTQTTQLYSNAQTAVKYLCPQCGGALLVKTLIDKLWKMHNIVA